jgi:hypothetical protein
MSILLRAEARALATDFSAMKGVLEESGESMQQGFN